MVSLIVSSILLIVLGANFIPAKVLALNIQSRLESIAPSFVMRMPQLRAGDSEGIFFLGDKRTLEPGIIAASLKTFVISDQSGQKSSLEIRSRGFKGENIYLASNAGSGYLWRDKISSLNTGIKILPNGSVVMGGTSNNFLDPGPTTFTVPQTLHPQFHILNSSQRHNGIYDFFFSMPQAEETGSISTLFTRIFRVHDMGTAPEIVLARSGDSGRYGQVIPMQRGQVIGSYDIENFTSGERFEKLTSIYATLDDSVNSGDPPGSLYFATVGSDQRLTNKMYIRYNGNVGIGVDRADAKLQVNGDIVATGSKNFVIDHPTKPGQKLIHAAIEGPEAGVYYRGEGKLVNGQATVKLPDYFEALTRKEGRTVSLTNIGGFDSIKLEGKVSDGKFQIISENKNSDQKFNWEVKAIRNDIPTLEVER